MYSDDLKNFLYNRNYHFIFKVDSYNQCGNTRFFSSRELAEEFVEFQSKFDIHCSIYEEEVFD